MSQSIYIYDDTGVGDYSRENTYSYFQSYSPGRVTAQDIIDGVLDKVDILVMPGGADLPYCEKLNGAGNATIKNFVHNGGTYVGICAGAYYACSDIEFQKDTSHEICEARELGLIPATARGCLREIASPYDETFQSAEIAVIDTYQGNIQAFYWGGPAFILHDDRNIKIHARYAKIKDTPPAIISKNIGKGRVLLSGVHFEVSDTLLSETKTQNDSEKQKLIKLSETIKPSYDTLDILIKGILNLT